MNAFKRNYALFLLFYMTQTLKYLVGCHVQTENVFSIILRYSYIFKKKTEVF